MVGVLVDACGWASLVDAGLNLDIALEGVVGSAELFLTDAVRKELDSLEDERGGLLLDLLYERASILDSAEGHTDDALVSLSMEKSWPVLTVDRRLKERLLGSGGSYIEVTSGPALRLVAP